MMQSCQNCLLKRSDFGWIKYRTSWRTMWNYFLLYLFMFSRPVYGDSGLVLVRQDLQLLATMFPGCYSNTDQYYKHVRRGLPPEKRHFLLRSEIYRVTKPLFNDSLDFFFQDFTKASATPFRSGFYSFAVDAKTKMVRMKTMQLTDKSVRRVDNISGYFSLDHEVAASLWTEADGLRTYWACDMFWKRLGDSTFVGITGPRCLGSLGSDQVRIGVSMTLTPDRLLLTDSWYKLSDGTSITEVKVPYILQKIMAPTKQLSDQPLKPPIIASSNQLPDLIIQRPSLASSNQRLGSALERPTLVSSNEELDSTFEQQTVFLSNQLPDSRKIISPQSQPDFLTSKQMLGPLANAQERMSNDLGVANEKHSTFKLPGAWGRRNDLPYNSDHNFVHKIKGVGKSQTRNPAKSPPPQQILSNFLQVAAALTSGHRVYYRVELSACSVPEQVSLDRLSFGGVVTNFIYVRKDGLLQQRNDYIYIKSQKTVMDSEGPEQITRQLTLLREGRVKVEITTTFSEHNKFKQGYAFECKLYSQLKGYGGIKMTINPNRHVRKISNFSSLAKSVIVGRDLHLVADLARCQGSMRKPTVVVGSQITNYDFVNSGKTLELFLPFPHRSTTTATSSPEALAQGFVAQILKNGDVILTLVSNSQSKNSLDRLYNLSPAYHCVLSDRNDVTLNDESEQSVKVFYVK